MRVANWEPVVPEQVAGQEKQVLEQGSLGAQVLESQGPPALVCSVVQVQGWLRVLEPGWL